MEQRGRFGFGCYRVSDASSVHEDAMRLALSLGIDVIDTSHNYMKGASERLVGRVLHSLDQGSATRPVVITKLTLTTIEEMEDKFFVSLERLLSERVDVLLLHNPEDFLQQQHQEGVAIVDARTAFYDRLKDVFVWMEQQRTAGRIGSYGVSSNTFAHDVDAPDHISLQTCIETAQRAGGDANGFTHIQLPFNLIEHFLVTTVNQFEGESEPTLSTLEVAQQNNIHVIVNRPLNAIVGSDLIRLVSHDIPPHASAVDVLEASIHKLEIDEHEIMQRVQGAKQRSEQEITALQETFRVGGALCQSWNKFEGIIHWRDVRREYLAPRLQHAATFMSEVTADEGRLLEHYIMNMTKVLDGIDALYSAEENESLEELRATMADEFGLPLDTPLQHIALHAVRCTEGVDVVLVGMRTPEYIEDAILSYSLPETTYHRATWNRVAQHLARISQ